MAPISPTCSSCAAIPDGLFAASTYIKFCAEEDDIDAGDVMRVACKLGLELKCHLTDNFPTIKRGLRVVLHARGPPTSTAPAAALLVARRTLQFTRTVRCDCSRTCGPLR
jgi:hypothetical protein